MARLLDGSIAFSINDKLGDRTRCWHDRFWDTDALSLVALTHAPSRPLSPTGSRSGCCRSSCGNSVIISRAMLPFGRQMSLAPRWEHGNESTGALAHRNTAARPSPTGSTSAAPSKALRASRRCAARRVWVCWLSSSPSVGSVFRSLPSSRVAARPHRPWRQGQHAHRDPLDPLILLIPLILLSP
jgi:hypothetical protein